MFVRRTASNASLRTLRPTRSLSLQNCLMTSLAAGLLSSTSTLLTGLSLNAVCVIAVDSNVLLEELKLAGCRRFGFGDPVYRKVDRRVAAQAHGRLQAHCLPDGDFVAQDVLWAQIIEM